MAEAAGKMASMGDTQGRPVSKGTAQLPFGAEPLPGLPDVDDMIPGTSAHYLPRYQMPNISSILPSYSNSEQDFIKGAFAASDYTSLTTHVPDQIKCHSVNKMRSELMDSVRKPMTGPPPASHPTNITGLFQEFEYLPSRFNLEDELNEKERLDGHRKRREIAEQEWVPTNNYYKGKNEDGFVEGEYHPVLCDPYEAAQDMILRHNWMEDQKILHGAWVPGGGKEIGEAPGLKMTDEIIQTLHKIITADWEDVKFKIYENQDGHWVIRFYLDSVDSERGLIAYMNVFMRCNELVRKYQMTRVTENWNVKPGDGSIYFTLRPAWVVKKVDEDTFVAPPPHISEFVTRAREARAAEEAEENM
mmetsp:Transcript_33363/g.72785  ORF Transcript_33363/g.72785 Transcript_33363/m.72785 type:complete len:360 (-) Transcript_33363:224-1303(-)|eukprot:CAMPEP_0118924128 /NCGR_PEP_ID=MMETSP1169-20130426/2407_1 /TAXON_ID=36882 /ORGANISM="Pyramimonas obovata, Strain CCMP722" /LENGTH=359 /DNA_ID=CAMNT_0006865215 /DNA_START=167 /DNA_END=1246 /DNA_ORIENTATION=+